MYATDASLHRAVPLGVAFPFDIDDVRAIVRFANEEDTPLIARGAGTSTTGAALGPGLIVDFSRHMRRMLSRDDEYVDVEPGVVLSELNRQLRSTGHRFGPDPANAAVTTVGGMIGVNSSGSRSIAVGDVRRHTARTNVVLSDAEVLRTGADRSDDGGQHHSASGIVTRMESLLGERQELIERLQPQRERDSCGYFLRLKTTGGPIDLTPLLVGSEGTLGLLTQARLRIEPIPPHSAVSLVLFESLDDALAAAVCAADFPISACDLFDRRHLSLVRETEIQFEKLVPRAAGAALLIETEGEEAGDVGRRMADVLHAIEDVAATADVAAQAVSGSKTALSVDDLWSIPRKIIPRLTRLGGERRPVPIVEDIAVPPAALRDFVRNAQNVFQRYEVTATMYAHAAHGQIHFRPFLPGPGPERDRLLEAIPRDLYAVAIRHGGVISGEHGDGLSRSAFLRTQHGELYRVFREVKDIFDPHNLMNPGKIVTDDPHVTIRRLRQSVDSEALPQLQLRWSAPTATQVAADCNGCGNCKSRSDAGRMCPVFRADPAEASSPRSKANVFESFLRGDVTATDLASPAGRDLTDRCFQCLQCRSECPANVDIPSLVIEAKAAQIAVDGAAWPDWALSRVHGIGDLATATAFLSNPLLANSTVRWMLERTLGISRHRNLPRFARRPFLRIVPRKNREQATKSGDDFAAAYFVDQFANFFEPEIGLDLLRLLDAVGVRCVVPAGQTASGSAMLAIGDIEGARTLADQNVRVLGPLARRGLPIICTEPSALISLKEEYPRLLDHPDVAVIAKHAVDAGVFLREYGDQLSRLNSDSLLDTTIAHHEPCHSRTLQTQRPYVDLLRYLGSNKVEAIDEGCSGMAGTYGLTARNYDSSLAIGRPLIQRLKSGAFDVGTSECSACRMQMGHRSGLKAVHPIRLLARSLPSR
ncbi:Anaerobic glycerol-3-phosphate dehydrogenase subunit C [Stratiformator vulcanicus]|uniref:Anaerobic glycerol-3-phosphate dehydrogenase subunit C n=2 Tax=Stratiformator vulcanicus TaxID=2527980 RepID=A0A517R0S5_9PLAN|nr:Anaerobic glycerol-3-phosphate dehydrogenase subunit C [Stratiformator vulcanicus]